MSDDAARRRWTEAPGVPPTAVTGVASTVETGAEVAHPPLEIPGLGTFAIYIQGDVHHGLWRR